MLKLYIIGISILVTAIVANAIIGRIGIVSWYDFFELIKIHGSGAFKHLGIIDFIWLFLLYPFVLGLGYVIGQKLYGFLA